MRPEPGDRARRMSCLLPKAERGPPGMGESIKVFARPGDGRWVIDLGTYGDQVLDTCKNAWTDSRHISNLFDLEVGTVIDNILCRGIRNAGQCIDFFERGRIHID